MLIILQLDFWYIVVTEHNAAQVHFFVSLFYTSFLVEIPICSLLLFIDSWSQLFAACHVVRVNGHAVGMFHKLS